MRKPGTTGTRGKKEGELLEAAGLMDKTGVWSSPPACSQVSLMTVGSGMVVKDETTDTDGETSSAPRLSSWQLLHRR